MFSDGIDAKTEFFQNFAGQYVKCMPGIILSQTGEPGIEVWSEVLENKTNIFFFSLIVLPSIIILTTPQNEFSFKKLGAGILPTCFQLPEVQKKITAYTKSDSKMTEVSKD